MSFGKSSNSSNSKSQSTSQQELDPQIKAALLGNYAGAQALAATPYVPYTGQTVAPLTPAQQQAAAGVSALQTNNPGAAALTSALSTLNGVAAYKPVQVSAATYKPTNATAATTGPAALATAAQIDPNAVQQITAPTVGADQIAAFMDPYTDSVVSTTNADLERQRQIANVQNAGNATAQGAFGGSGSAVLDSLTNDSFTRAMATQDAALRSSGFSQALSAAQQQAAQQLAAAQANQGTSLQAGTTNANLNEQTGLSNQDAQNALMQFLAGLSQQTNLANQTAANEGGQFNAQQAMAAQEANQAAGLSAEGLKTTAAGQATQVGNDQLNQALGILNAVNQTGTQAQQTNQAQDTANYQQYLQQQQWPLLMQQLLNQTLGLAGNPILGNSQSTSTGNSSGSAFNFALPQPSVPIPAG